MGKTMKNDQVQTCPQCDNHCPVDALQCGRGRKYFGVAQDSQEHGHDHERGHEHGCGHGHHGHDGETHHCKHEGHGK